MQTHTTPLTHHIHTHTTPLTHHIHTPHHRHTTYTHTTPHTSHTHKTHTHSHTTPHTSHTHTHRHTTPHTTPHTHTHTHTRTHTHTCTHTSVQVHKLLHVTPLLIFRVLLAGLTASVGLVVRVSGYRYWGPGFDSRRYQIFWVVVGLERGPLSLVRSTEELLELKK